MSDRTVAWDRAQNVLCVRLDALGDVLMTTPAIRAIKESRPGCRVTLLTSPSGAAVAPLIPEVDAHLVYEAPWMKSATGRDDVQIDLDMIKRLRSGDFDAAVIFTVFSQSALPAALLCHLAGIPLRLAHCRENPYQLLTDWIEELEIDGASRHEVRRQLDLVAAVGASARDEGLSLRVPEEARQRVRELLRSLGIHPGDRWAVVHPGASAPSRRYAPAAFAEAARRLVTERGWRVVFSGDAGESALVEWIRERTNATSDSVAGMLSLAELAALIESAPVLISNNTGPVHIAAAVGTAVVDLYALTNPQHTPWLVPSRVLNHDVPCQPCYKSVCPEGHHHCLSLVEPGEVVRSAVELMETA